MKFITSDTHFSHILISNNRGFGDDFQKHDEWLIEKWNSVITDNDTVYHLGDVVFQPATRIEIVLPQLKGKKILIMGNHDKAKQLIPYFHEIYSVNLLNGLVLSHVPVHESQMNGRFAEFVNLHGHLHHKQDLGKQYYNVNCEFHDFVPISIEQIRENIRSLK